MNLESIRTQPQTQTSDEARGAIEAPSLEKFLDPRERAVAEELVGAVLEVHGEGLARMLELVGEETAKELADDPDRGQRAAHP